MKKTYEREETLVLLLYNQQEFSKRVEESCPHDFQNYENINQKMSLDELSLSKDSFGIVMNGNNVSSLKPLLENIEINPLSLDRSKNNVYIRGHTKEVQLKKNVLQRVNFSIYPLQYKYPIVMTISKIDRYNFCQDERNINIAQNAFSLEKIDVSEKDIVYNHMLSYVYLHDDINIQTPIINVSPGSITVRQKISNDIIINNKYDKNIYQPLHLNGQCQEVEINTPEIVIKKVDKLHYDISQTQPSLQQPLINISLAPFYQPFFEAIDERNVAFDQLQFDIKGYYQGSEPNLPKAYQSNFMKSYSNSYLKRGLLLTLKEYDLKKYRQYLISLSKVEKPFEFIEHDFQISLNHIKVTTKSIETKQLPKFQMYCISDVIYSGIDLQKQYKIPQIDTYPEVKEFVEALYQSIEIMKTDSVTYSCPQINIDESKKIIEELFKI
ncbi:hypothetical protein [uncultured Thomasclavelia sp.]|uniref:hypothetical protein n=1 Tax=uncultured Thomasclavelia sp. TaxID=3025759 RepID=UPI0025DE1611|nr:hypothetical protein [uncultured Thomasclavelia sp.]